MSEEVKPVETLKDVTKIVILALSIALIGLTIIGVVIGFEARSTQANADSNARSLESVTKQLESVMALVEDVTAQNEALQNQLGCLRLPSFEADEADAKLAITTARGLAAVSAGDSATLATLTTDLTDGADFLEAKIEVRRLSIDGCAEDPNWMPPPNTIP